MTLIDVSDGDAVVCMNDIVMYFCIFLFDYTLHTGGLASVRLLLRLNIHSGCILCCVLLLMLVFLFVIC